MTTKFKDKFFSLAKFLGGSARTLHEHLGKYDEKDEDEHRTYVWFKDTKASFYVGNDDIVGWFSAPKADVYGHSYFDQPDYFSIDGIKQGMSKNDVLQLWGEPDWKAERVFGYKNHGGSASNGQKFELCVEFTEQNSTLRVSHFEARIIKKEERNTYQPNQSAPKSSGGCFIATACYGNYNAPEVLVLRQYRDNVLLNSNFGKIIVQIYYFVSPPLARLIENSDILKKFIRQRLLSPIISKIKGK